MILAVFCVNILDKTIVWIEIHALRNRAQETLTLGSQRLQAQHAKSLHLGFNSNPVSNPKQGSKHCQTQ